MAFWFFHGRSVIYFLNHKKYIAMSHFLNHNKYHRNGTVSGAKNEALMAVTNRASMKNPHLLTKESFVDNSKSSTCFVEVAPLPFYSSDITGLEIPAGARAVLVGHAGDGRHIVTPIGDDQSVLNIRRDLWKHLNEAPQTTDFLEELRDYATARLQAREDARRGGTFMMPGPGVNEWRQFSKP